MTSTREWIGAPRHRGLALQEILGWDAVSWSVPLALWAAHLPAAPCDCLELGCGPGGVSLWLAARGHRVVCSDLDGPGAAARELHARHGVEANIRYEALDATSLPYSESFDVVVCKSILGGIWARRGEEAFHRAIGEARKALRPRGMFLFAENMRATALHMFCRKRFISWNWHYPRIAEMHAAFRHWGDANYALAGFLATFGRSERQRSILGYVDRAIHPVVPESWRYIMAGVVRREGTEDESGGSAALSGAG